jgi:protein-S-isoprenylcysteine O-methyltransferase Ste14
MTASRSAFWKGSRGEWYLVIQTCLFLLIAFGPRSYPDLTGQNRLFFQIAATTGGILLLTGVLMTTAGVVHLGRNLTPLPHPKEHATLVVSGAYRFVRHPIYSGIAFMAFGWSLWLGSGLTAGYALLLFIFFDIKSRREERLLAAKFPEYAAYRTRVHKLIPFIY